MLADPPLLQLPDRPPHGHKGTFGRVLIVAGSQGMTGAAALSGLGALRGGAGLVYIAAPQSVVPTIAAIEPSYLTIPLPDDQTTGCVDRTAASLLEERSAGMDVLAIGPGLGHSGGVDAVVPRVHRDASQPVVVDADALNALARTETSFSDHAGPRILTPHPGEFSRLCGRSLDDIQSHREELAAGFAAQHDVILVLKGPGTIVTDGERVSVNDTGNSGMGTGGTGDVLTGLLAALLAQGMSPLEAAQLGVWMHGRAGDLAAGHFSEAGLIASDLPRYLGRVWLELQHRFDD